MEEVYRGHTVFTLENDIVDFYFDKETLNINSRKYVLGKGWEFGGKIFEKAHPDFDCDCDDNGNFHIVCQDVEGCIHKITWKNGTIGRVNLLQSKARVCDNKNIQLRCKNGKEYAFILLRESLDDGILAVIETNNQVASNPKVIDRISLKNSRYKIVSEDDSTLKVVYYSIKDKKIKIFNVLDKNEIKREEISDMQGEWSGVWLKHNKNIVISLQEENEMFVFKQNKENKENKVNILHKLRNKPYFWEVINYDEDVVLYWFGEQGLMKVSSKDGGDSWSKANLHTTRYLSKLEICSWINKDYWSGEQRQDYIPAILANSFSPEFFEEKLNKSNIQFGKVFPKMNAKFKENEIQVRECVQGMDELNCNYSEIIRRLDLLERELAKLEIQIKIMK